MPVPELLEEKLQEREVSRLVANITENFVDESRLEGERNFLGGFDDCPPELAASHRANVDDRVLQLVTERPVLQRPSIKVAADRQNQRESWFATQAFKQYAHESIAF